MDTQAANCNFHSRSNTMQFNLQGQNVQQLVELNEEEESRICWDDAQMREGEVPIQRLKEKIFSDMDTQISGYFFKRRDAHSNKSLKGFMKKYLGIGYDKRFFKIDLEKLTIRYAKDPTSIDDKLSFEEQVRNIISVKKNVITMPAKDKNGKHYWKKIDAFDLNMECDRGPTDGCLFYHVFEIYTVHKTFTLYTQDGDLMNRFVHYLDKMLELKDEILHYQMKRDQQMKQMHEKFELEQDARIQHQRKKIQNKKAQRKLSNVSYHSQKEGIKKKDSLIGSISMLYNSPPPGARF